MIVQTTFEDELDSTLWQCGFLTERLAKQFDQPVTPIHPGVFVGHRSGDLEPIFDDDRPYNSLAIDRRYGKQLDNWCWVGGWNRERPGIPLLDRVSDLAEFVRRKTLWIRESLEDPRTGSLHGPEEGLIGGGQYSFPSARTAHSPIELYL